MDDANRRKLLQEFLYVTALFKLQTCSSFTEAIVVIPDLKKKYEKLPAKVSTHSITDYH